MNIKSTNKRFKTFFLKAPSFNKKHRKAQKITSSFWKLQSFLSVILFLSFVDMQLTKAFNFLFVAETL